MTSFAAAIAVAGTLAILFIATPLGGQLSGDRYCNPLTPEHKHITFFKSSIFAIKEPTLGKFLE
jgi:hypothetical protein